MLKIYYKTGYNDQWADREATENTKDIESIEVVDQEILDPGIYITHLFYSKINCGKGIQHKIETFPKAKLLAKKLFKIFKKYYDAFYQYKDEAPKYFILLDDEDETLLQMICGLANNDWLDINILTNNENILNIISKWVKDDLIISRLKTTVFSYGRFGKRMLIYEKDGRLLPHFERFPLTDPVTNKE